MIFRGQCSPVSRFCACGVPTVRPIGPDGVVRCACCAAKREAEASSERAKRRLPECVYCGRGTRAVDADGDPACPWNKGCSLNRGRRARAQSRLAG